MKAKAEGILGEARRRRLSRSSPRSSRKTTGTARTAATSITSAVAAWCSHFNVAFNMQVGQISDP